jgi:2-polyprenyl-3-methyl-5-hydroxy-6-metoxy-1,4-benzoquinol methylase
VASGHEPDRLLAPQPIACRRSGRRPRARLGSLLRLSHNGETRTRGDKSTSIAVDRSSRVEDAFGRWAALQAQSTDPTNRLDEQTDLAFWEQVAPTYDEGALAVRVPAVLERIRGLVRPGASVLDVGAGTGAFALPLATLASRVTAIDYSPAMLRILGLKLAATGTQNVRPVLARWEDAVVEPHDVVLTANALYRTADLRSALRKMIDLGRRRGIIVWSVGRQPLREHVQPEGYRPGPDYVHALEGLFHLDVFANVEVIARVAVMWWDGPEAEVVAHNAVASRS